MGLKPSWPVPIWPARSCRLALGAQSQDALAAASRDAGSRSRRAVLRLPKSYLSCACAGATILSVGTRPVIAKSQSAKNRGRSLSAPSKTYQSLRRVGDRPLVDRGLDAIGGPVDIGPERLSKLPAIL